MPNSFAIVHFINSHEVELVPLSWIKENHCFWPPVKGKNVANLVKKMVKPVQTWTTHEVKVIATFATYVDGRKYLKKAEDTSDVLTEPEAYGRGKRKRVESSSTVSSLNDELTFTEMTDIILPSPPKVVNLNVPHCSQYLANQDFTVLAENVCSQTEHDTGKDLAYKALMKEVLIIKANQKNIIENQQEIIALLNIVRNTEMNEQQSPLPFSFPLKTDYEVDEVEKVLANDCAIHNRLVEFFGFIGGTTVESTVRRILRNLFTNEVAQNFSWVGAKGKRAFEELRLSKVLFDAVRKSSVAASATNAVIEGIIKNWLRHAKARIVQASKTGNTNLNENS